MLKIGDRFPSFNLKGVMATELSKAFVDTNNNSHAGSWKVFFFYPKDFTFICPTELVGFNDHYAQFQKLNTQVYGASTDSDFVHHAWLHSDPKLKALQYPLLADIKKELATALGILDEKEGICYRATFIVDPEGIIRHSSINDLSVGRNVKEILRTLEALQSGELCACDWQPGTAHLKIAG